MTATDPTATNASAAEPRWLFLVAATIGFGLLFALVLSPRTALYWYVFPLYGAGATYLWQFRAEITRPWVVAFVVSAVVSAAALALDWPFSGHVLWTVLFLGHIRETGKRSTAWTAVMCVSLAHLFVMKIAFQTGRDVVGAFISVGVALVALLVLARTPERTGGASGR